MRKAVTTALAIFTALTAMLIGVTTGLGERYLEPSGITEKVYSPQRASGSDGYDGSDYSELSCGSAWKPYDRAPDPAERVSADQKSKLSDVGVIRCTAVLAGTGLLALLLTAFGGGVLLILFVGYFIELGWSRERKAATELALRGRER